MFPDRVLSGMRPTGRLHLGHYHGALKNWVKLQHEHPCFFFVADWHALTTHYETPEVVEQYTYDTVIDWIASGIDPAQATLFAQSKVPQHAELTLLLSFFTPLSWLERVPTFKDQLEKQSQFGRDLTTYGFLGYPLMQAADILIYRANQVPVGEDQVPHLELTREVVRRFSNFYPCGLVEPQAILTPTPRLPGLDNRKMSKSYNNTIDLSDTADDVVKKVRQMYTDPKRVRADIPGTVEGNPVFIYHDAFNPNTAEVDDLKARYRAGKVGDVEVKTKLSTAINTLLEPIRTRRAQALQRPDDIRDILLAGSKRAREVAGETMERVRAAVRLKY